jgi:hypothetical protein
LGFSLPKKSFFISLAAINKAPSKSSRTIHRIHLVLRMNQFQHTLRFPKIFPTGSDVALLASTAARSFSTP